MQALTLAVLMEDKVNSFGAHMRLRLDSLKDFSKKNDSRWLKDAEKGQQGRDSIFCESYSRSFFHTMITSERQRYANKWPAHTFALTVDIASAAKTFMPVVSCTS